MSLRNANGNLREEKKAEADGQPCFFYIKTAPETMKIPGAFVSYYMRYPDLFDVDSVQKSFALIHSERVPPF